MDRFVFVLRLLAAFCGTIGEGGVTIVEGGSLLASEFVDIDLKEA